MRRSLLLTCALLLVPLTAHAEDDDDEEMVIVETPAAEPPPEAPPVMIVTPRADVKKWVDVSYASETTLVDGAAVAMFVYGVATETQPFPGLGILTYGLGAPIAHFTHGNVAKGIADIGIRIVAPFVVAVPGAMISALFTPEHHEGDGTTDIGVLTGLAIGSAFAMAVDALVLAKERVPAERAYMIACRGCNGRGSQLSSSSPSSFP